MCVSRATLKNNSVGRVMSPAYSSYLNAVRAFAALAVVVWHSSFSVFAGDRLPWVYNTRIGLDAVAVFFVLSGLVIAHTAATKDRTWRDYAFNRATRIYSVLVPALAFNVIVGYFLGFNPDAGSVVRTLTYTTHTWIYNGPPRAFTPVWSVTYEMWYYAIFGCVAYLSGWRRSAFAFLVGILAGPLILLLIPCWWGGVWVYRRLDRPRSVSWAWTLTLAPLIIYANLSAQNVLGIVDTITSAAFAPLNASRFFVHFWIVAGLAAMHLLGAATLMRNRKAVGAAFFGWAGGAAFSLYLTHFTTLYLMRAIFPGRIALMVPACIAVALLFAWAFERRVGTMRRFLARRYGRLIENPV